jgi:hypothetical protein
MTNTKNNNNKEGITSNTASVTRLNGFKKKMPSQQHELALLAHFSCSLRSFVYMSCLSLTKSHFSNINNAVGNVHWKFSRLLCTFQFILCLRGTLSGWEIGRDLRDEKFMLRIYFLMIFYFQ